MSLGREGRRQEARVGDTYTVQSTPCSSSTKATGGPGAQTPAFGFEGPLLPRHSASGIVRHLHFPGKWPMRSDPKEGNWESERRRSGCGSGQGVYTVENSFRRGLTRHSCPWGQLGVGDWAGGAAGDLSGAEAGDIGLALFWAVAGAWGLA